jgi:hypothetical protein
MSRQIESIDVNNLVFSKLKNNSSNKFLYVYSDKKPLILKLGKSRLPFGIQKDTLSKKPQFLLDISMESAKSTLESFEALDKAIIEKVNREFYPDLDFDQVKSKYTGYLKYPTDSRYSPTLRAKVIIDESGNPKCDFYESEKIDGKYPKIDVVGQGNGEFLLKKLEKGTFVDTIIECIGLWQFGEKFGLSFKVTQVLVHPKQEEPKVEEVCQFVDSESDTSNSDAEFLGE